MYLNSSFGEEKGTPGVGVGWVKRCDFEGRYATMAKKEVVW